MTVSQTQSKGLRNEETQQHWDIENRSIITIKNQQIQLRQKQQEKFKQIKKPHIAPNSNENLQKWSRNTTLIVGDSMLSGTDQRRISKRDRKVKVKNFPFKPLLKKCPNNIILHLGTNNTVNESSLTVIKTNEHLHGLQMDIIDNGNITSNELNKGRLHLNPRGLGKLTINFIRRIKKFATT